MSDEERMETLMWRERVRQTPMGSPTRCAMGVAGRAYTAAAAAALRQMPTSPRGRALMSEYWMGVLSVPAVVLMLVVARVAWPASTWLVTQVGSWGVERVTSIRNTNQRRRVAATIYGAKRVWLFHQRRLGIAFVVGDIDHDDVRRASERLLPTLAEVGLDFSDEAER